MPTRLTPPSSPTPVGTRVRSITHVGALSTERAFRRTGKAARGTRLVGGTSARPARVIVGAPAGILAGMKQLHIRPTRIGRSAFAGLAVGALLITGCNEGGGDVGVAERATATEILEQARDSLFEAGTVRLELSSEGLPDDGSVLLAGSGVGQLDAPAFEGEVTARMMGLQADVPVVAVDGDLHVQLPYTSRYVTRTPDELGVPDPATLFDPERGVVTLLTQTDNAEFGDQTRARDEVLQQVTGTVPEDAVTTIFRVGEGEFEVTYGILDDETPELRTVTLTGEFYPPQVSSYTLNLSDYGLDVDISAP